MTHREITSDMADLIAQDQAARLYSRRLIEHPDPRDPDWPGHEREANQRSALEQFAEDMETARDWCDRAAHAARAGRKAEAKAHLMEADELIQGAYQSIKGL